MRRLGAGSCAQCRAHSGLHRGPCGLGACLSSCSSVQMVVIIKRPAVPRRGSMQQGVQSRLLRRWPCLVMSLQVLLSSVVGLVKIKAYNVK